MVPLLETEVGTVRQVTKSQIKLLALTSSLSFLVSTAHLLVLRAIPPRERDEGTERKAEWHETRWAVKRRGREQNMSDRDRPWAVTRILYLYRSCLCSVPFLGSRFPLYSVTFPSRYGTVISSLWSLNLLPYRSLPLPPSVGRRSRGRSPTRRKRSGRGKVRGRRVSEKNGKRRGKSGTRLTPHASLTHTVRLLVRVILASVVHLTPYHLLHPLTSPSLRPAPPSDTRRGR